MPRVKQPTSLQTLAFDVLVEWVVHFCDNLSVEISLEKLRKGVAVVKEDVCKSLPSYLLGSFCSKILDRFYSAGRPASHHQALLEIAMDTEIVGLAISCNSPIFRCLSPEDARRLRRLEILDYVHFSDFGSTGLGNFDLSNLRQFVFANDCTDHHLRIVGQNCPLLEVLIVRYSRVTDQGVSALKPCSELRVVDVTHSRVSYEGINRLLSAHKKLEKLINEGKRYFPTIRRKCDVFCDLDFSVQCPSVTHFHIDAGYVTCEELRSFVTKFPNLSYIVLDDSVTSDLAILRSLDKLTGLELNFSACTPSSAGNVSSTWESLKELLKIVGVKITTLKLYWYGSNSFSSQEQLDLIFDFCPNVEHLEFDHATTGRPLVVPPFRELKKLRIKPPASIGWIGELDLDPQLLEFGVLSNLETLSLSYYKISLEFNKSIVLDNVKCPKLSVMEIFEPYLDIEQLSRDNNLDFRIVKYAEES